MKRQCDLDQWSYVDCIITSIQRQTTIEVFLEQSYQYCCVPFSCFATRNRQKFLFRLVCYSGEKILIKSVSDMYLQRSTLSSFYRKVLSCEPKLCYPVAASSILACIQAHGCAVFVALNGTNDCFLSIKLSIHLPQDGLVVSLGSASESYDIPPRCQSVLAIVSSDGKLSSATQFSFSYISSTIQSSGKNKKQDHEAKDVNIPVELSLAADLLVNSSSSGAIKEHGRDTIDTFLWIPQLLSAAVHQ